MSCVELKEGQRVIVENEAGERVAEYGNASRVMLGTAPKSPGGFMKVYTSGFAEIMKLLRNHSTTQTILAFIMNLVDNGKSEVFVNQSEIGERIGIPHQQVSKSMKQLQELGILIKVGESGKLNKYMLRPDIFVRTNEPERRKASVKLEKYTQPEGKLEEDINDLQEYVSNCKVNLEKAEERLHRMRTMVRNSTKLETLVSEVTEDNLHKETSW